MTLFLVGTIRALILFVVNSCDTLVLSLPSCGVYCLHFGCFRQRSQKHFSERKQPLDSSRLTAIVACYRARPKLRLQTAVSFLHIYLLYSHRDYSALPIGEKSYRNEESCRHHRYLVRLSYPHFFTGLLPLLCLVALFTDRS